MLPPLPRLPPHYDSCCFLCLSATGTATAAAEDAASYDFESHRATSSSCSMSSSLSCIGRSCDVCISLQSYSSPFLLLQHAVGHKHMYLTPESWFLHIIGAYSLSLFWSSPGQKGSGLPGNNLAYELYSIPLNNPYSSPLYNPLISPI